MDRKRMLLVVMMIVISMFASGCVAAVAAGAAGGAGSYVWASGKLSFVTPHNINESHRAAVSALGELGTKITGDTTDMLAGRIKAVTATNEEVTIDLEPQSLQMTKIDVRVGFWGNEAQSRLIANSIKRHLD